MQTSAVHRRAIQSLCLWAAVCTGCAFLLFSGSDSKRHTNAVGMELVRIEPGAFTMGADAAPLLPELLSGKGLEAKRPESGDFDESPAHEIRITEPFFISAEEVTAEQFSQFRSDYTANSEFALYASGISWDEAVAFCRWLSKKDGHNYRLPTEAEWEYAARAGTRTPFASGIQPPAPGVPNQWGLRNMNSGLAEWVWDWYGLYPASPQTDPVGPASGIGRVIRGGGLDDRDQKHGDHAGHFPAELPYYARSANRASLAPSFQSPKARIGFRVVEAPMPPTKPWPADTLFLETAVKQTAVAVTQGPDPKKPFYRTKEIFPDLHGHTMADTGWKIGFTRGLGMAYHNSAVQVMPNGDLLAAYYNTPEKEDDPDQTVLTMRLRYGSEEWDMPEPWPNFADAADAAPVIWNDKGKVWFFWGCSRLLGAAPFQYMTSNDNGATWSAVTYPHLVGPVGKFTPQPINSVVRTKDGTIYLPVDATGGTSVLFATHDNGANWFDTGGRTDGRHTTLVVGKDGALLGFGGKNTNIDGKMPLSTSRDGGKTYELSKTPFNPLGSGQRPSVIRLASGKLFFVADNHTNKKPGQTKLGAYVALSSDDGKTWTFRDLPSNIVTVGYVTATQGPNGLIHIITSKNKPNFEISLNEAWIEGGGEECPRATSVTDVRAYRELYPNGKVRLQWEAGIGDDKTYLLHGTQIAYYDNGQKQWECRYVAGRKQGNETYWNRDGRKEWDRTYQTDGSWQWRIFDESDRTVATSNWQGKTLTGVND